MLQGGAGDDIFDGGPGNDTVAFAEPGVTTPETADLSGASAACGGIPCASSAQLGLDTFVLDGTTHLSSVENLSGTPAADALTGDGGANRIVGLGGSDVMRGDAGNDTLSGGRGLDAASYLDDPAGITATLIDGTITDGFGGTDAVTSVEEVQGSNSGSDLLTGTTSANRLFGNGGDDTLNGLAGSDVLDGGGGNDTLNGGSGTDTCTTGETVSNCELLPGHSPGRGSSSPGSGLAGAEAKTNEGAGRSSSTPGR
jgi:Ca2+-binding RTX toxin-like protein